MIDDAVLYLANDFSLYWSKYFLKYPKCQLDFTFPSLGVLDRLLMPLRLKERLSEREEIMILGSSAYIGAMVYDVWSNFPDSSRIGLKFKTKENEEEKEEILLSASGGKFMSQRESFRINITEALKYILSTPLTHFPVFPFFYPPIAPDDNLISLFSKSLICALSPFGEGEWKNLKLKNISKFLKTSDLIMSQTSSAYYRNAFPGERIGKDPNLYASQMILPPLGFKENYIGSFLASGIGRYLNNKKLNKKEIIALGTNLALSPDDTFSKAGFMILASEIKSDDKKNEEIENPNIKKVLLAREIIGEKALNLKPAIMILRAIRNKENNWLEHIVKENYEEANKIIETEKISNLLPFLTLPLEYLKKEDFILFFAAVNFGSPIISKYQLDLLRERKENFNNVDLIIQSLYIDLYMHNKNISKKNLEILKKEDLKNNPYNLSFKFEIFGIYYFLNNQYEKSIENLKNAFSLIKKDLTNTARRTKVVEYLVLSLTNLGLYEEAINSSELILKENPYSITSRLNLCFLLKKVKDPKESLRQFKLLSKIAPLDIRVFNELRNYLKENK